MKKLSIRHLLFFLLAVPIIIVYGVVAFVQLRVESNSVATQTKRRLTEKTVNHAAMCDMIFSNAAETAEGLADFVSVSNPTSTKEVTDYFQLLLQKHPLILGGCVAFEPNQFPGYETHHAPYLYRPWRSGKVNDVAKVGEVVEVGEVLGDFLYKDLALEDYTSYDWYIAPTTTRKPVWSEPYYDTAGAGTLMCTYSVPFFTDSGELKGIATIDISLDSIRETINVLNTDDAEFILFSKEGRVITAKNTQWEKHETLSSLVNEWRPTEGQQTIENLTGDESGFFLAYCPRLNGCVFFAFAPLKENEWFLLVSLPERAVMGPVYRKVVTSMVIYLVGILILVVVLRMIVVHTGAVFHREVTHATETSQKEHDTFVNNVFTTIQDGMFIIDREYTILRANPTFETMYQEFHPLIGKKCWETSCRDKVCENCPAEKMFKSGKLELAVHYEEPTVTKEEMWLEHFSYPIFGEKEIIVGGVNFVRDVTKRKKMEDSIQRYQHELEALVQERTAKLVWSEARMKAVLDGNVPIVFYTPDGIVEKANSAMERTLGFAESAMVGRTVISLYHPDFHTAGTTKRQQLFDEGIDHVRLDLPFVHQNGDTVWGDICLTGMRDDNHNLVQIVGLCLDMTEKHELNEKLETARQFAEKSAHAKSEFLANMSHEIRTPMNAILGLTYLCLQTELDEKQRDLLEKSQSATKKLLRIIDDILDFSKIEAGKLSIEKVPFRLSETIKGVREVVGHKAEQKGLHLRLDVDSAVPDNLIGDPLRLYQVLVNLAGNAVKFTDRGEVAITVKCGVAAISTPQTISLSFTIRDTGIGMTTEQVSRLFSSFTQADSSMTRKYGGTGLGLVISRNLIDLMGGMIQVASVPEQGTEFSFTLEFPVGEADGTDISSPQWDENLAQRRILIVDDSEMDREFISRVAHTCTHYVDTAEGGEQAISQILRAAEEDKGYDVVLIDWKMPRMDGIETIHKLRDTKELVNPPEVLIVSAYDKSECMRLATDLDVAGFLVKPVTAQTFREAVSLAIANHQAAIAAAMATSLAAMDTPIPSSFPTPTSTSISTPPPISIPVSVPAQPHDIAGAKVLLVEDNKINQIVAQGLLKIHGIEPTLAGDGAIAVEMVKNHDFDLILMDVQMPNMDGLEATQLIRQLDKPNIDKLPIIAMTAHAMDSDYRRSLEVGMNDHLTKPIDPEKLRKTLEMWIRKR